MKRFTDTKLGRRAWFRKLSPRLKCAWRFLCDECDEAGVWSIDEEALEFHVGERVPLADILIALNSDDEVRVRVLGNDKLFLPGFIAFQYGTLSEDCKPHQKVISRLKTLTLWKGYAKGLLTHKEEEEEEDKEEEEGGVGGETKSPPPKLDQIWNQECGALPKVQAVNTSRKQRIRSRLLEEPDPERWREIVRRIAVSNFCNGGGSTGWRADFDWLLQPDTRLKVIEGKYDDRSGPSAEKVDIGALLRGAS